MQTDLDAMKLERTKLEAQLLALNSTIQDQEVKIASLPDTIDQAKRQIKVCIKEDILLKTKLQNIQKSSDDDQRILDNFNQTQAQVIDVINRHLGL
jgi:hypothetical protein